MMQRKMPISKMLLAPVSSDNSGDAKRKMETIFKQSLAILSADQVPTVSSKSLSAKRKNSKGDSQTEAKAIESYSKSLPIHIDNFSLQRRALVDAAKALATLWKIPETRDAKLRNRGLQLSRENS